MFQVHLADHDFYYVQIGLQGVLFFLELWVDGGKLIKKKKRPKISLYASKRQAHDL